MTRKDLGRELQPEKLFRLGKVHTSIQRLWLAHVGYCTATYYSSCFWDSCTSSRLTSSTVICGSNMSCPMPTQRMRRCQRQRAIGPASCLLQNSAARLMAQKSPHRSRFQTRACARQTKAHGGIL